MWTLNYRPELDGVRAIAVYLVLLFHAGMVTFDGGFIGVDVFFVLSWFLVTGVLLRDLSVPDLNPPAMLGNFYARRVKRLLPAAAAVIALVALLQLLVAGLPTRIEFVDDARASLLYFANWHFIVEGRDYFAGAEGASPFLHFWSLSIEEQFYIVYPLLVLLVWRRSRRPVFTLAWVVGLVGLVSVALQVWVARTDINLAYYGTHTRIYQLTAGAALMLLVHTWSTRGREVSARLAGALAVLGVAGIVVVASALTADLSQSNRGLLATVASVTVIAGLWWSPRGVLSRLLASGVPRYLGQISYGTYLWHWPVTLVLGEVFDIRPLTLSVLTAVVATGLAALSFQVLETPIRRTKVMRTTPWRMTAMALAGSVVLALVLLPPVFERDARPALAATQGGATAMSPALDKPLPKGLDLVAAKNDIGPRVKPCTAEDTSSCTLAEGSAQHLLLVGDSQARMFAPALVRLAKEHDLTLSVHVMQGCAWQVDQVNERATPREKDDCVEQRRTFYEDVLPGMDVDVVMAMGLSRSDEYWRSRLTSPSSEGEESLEEMQLRTTTLTADLVEAAGADLVIVRSVLGTDGYTINGFDPIECLAAARRLGDCAVPVPIKQPSVDATYVNLALTRDRVDTIDLNPMICPDAPVCAPVLGQRVVWKDRNHVTATLLADRVDKVWDQLRETSGFASSS